MVRVEVAMPSEAEVICSADGKYSLSFNLSVNLPVEGLIDQLLSLSRGAGADTGAPVVSDSLYPLCEEEQTVASLTPNTSPSDPFLQTPFSALRAEDVAYREYLHRGRWPVAGDFFVKCPVSASASASSASASAASPAKLRTASTASTVFSAGGVAPSFARPAPPPPGLSIGGGRPRAMSEASCLLGPCGLAGGSNGAENFAAGQSCAPDSRSRALTMNHWAPPSEENSGDFPIQQNSECKQM